MHMADALISPAVGGTLWAVAGGLIAWCARKVASAMRDNLVPMMGVLGAFIFAAQMINFTIPGTGSSGHLGGGLILAVLLGPHAAFLVIASVLTVQAFFFADGGLLALGANIVNLGFFPAFIAYPLLYRSIAGASRRSFRAGAAAVVAAVVGLQLGALAVVVETMASGVSDLPFGTFLMLMLPIHLAIGVVEGLATAAVVAFVARARPDTVSLETPVATRSILAGLAVAAVIVGGFISWFASSQPDGLEWSLARASGQEEFAGTDAELHGQMAAIQEKTAVLPDYGFKESFETSATHADEGDDAAGESWPAVSAGTSVSGLLGGMLTLVLVVLAGWLLKRAGGVRRQQA